MKLFFNVAILISFFSVVASVIWLVWYPRKVALNTVATALIVLVTLLMCNLSWYVYK